MSTSNDQRTPTRIAEANSPELSEFLCALEAGNLEFIRAQIAAGFDLATLDRFGRPILGIAVIDLCYAPGVSAYEVVKELLNLGANPNLQGEDSSGPLFEAVLNMDTEMLRILLVAGADPNIVEMDDLSESLYDWAEFDYRYEIWNVNNFGNPTPQDHRDEDTWLKYLTNHAREDGKREPDHLQLLRAYGALSASELSEMAGSRFYGVMDKFLDKFDLCLEIETLKGPEGDLPEKYATTLVTVNGNPVETYQVVDVQALVKSLSDPGHFEIFICNCGAQRNCGAMFHGVDVKHRHNGRQIGWELKHPQYVYPAHDPYDGSDGPATTLNFWFKRTQIIEAMQAYFRRLRSHCLELNHVNLEWPINSQTAMDILQIEDLLEKVVCDQTHGNSSSPF